MTDTANDGGTQVIEPGTPVDPAAAPASAPAAAPVVEGAAPVTSELTNPAPHPTDAVNSTVGEDGAVVYEATGDAALDVALTFLGGLGIAGNDPAVEAASQGNFSLLEAKLATLGDTAQGWQQMLALAKDAYQRSTAAYAEHVKATDTAILSVVQSADNWKAITAWAAKNADPAEKAEINRMIDGGPVQARAAATLLLNAYKSATGTVINPANPARFASAAPVAAQGPLSPRDYSQKVAELHRKLGSRMESSPEYRALRAQLAR